MTGFYMINLLENKWMFVTYSTCMYASVFECAYILDSTLSS